MKKIINNIIKEACPLGFCVFLIVIFFFAGLFLAGIEEKETPCLTATSRIVDNKLVVNWRGLSMENISRSNLLVDVSCLRLERKPDYPLGRNSPDEISNEFQTVPFSHGTCLFDLADEGYYIAYLQLRRGNRIFHEGFIADVFYLKRAK